LIKLFFLKEKFGYLTRLFHPKTRRPLLIAVMTKHTWDEINGDAVIVPMEETAWYLPTRVVQADIQGITLCIADYDLWKEQVRAKQAFLLGGESNGETF